MKMSIIQANSSNMNNRILVDLTTIIELKVRKNNSKELPQTAEV